MTIDNKSRLHIYSNPAAMNHFTGPGFPESIDRYEVLMDLFAHPDFKKIPHIECRELDTDALLLAHPQRYIDRIAELTPDNGILDVDGDVVMSPGTWNAALAAANTVCLAVDDVASGECARAFCAVRPPGHHALPEKPMGFCFFNNIFIGARRAQEKHNIKRIAIVDFDVHHGNGTDFMTRQAKDIFFVSSHQSPLWPGTGDPKDDEKGKTLNIPLPPGSGSAEFRAAYEHQVFPALEEFRPELLMISAGFDAHVADPLAGLALLENDFEWVTTRLCQIATSHCKGRAVSVLEGGYNLEALRASVAAHLRALAET